METLFEKIGPQKLKRLVNLFYDEIQRSSIQHLFQTDMSIVRDKQYMFLTQFLGGPQLYSNQYGHPKMRMRHLPHAIDQEAAIEWLRCMRSAIDQEFEDKELGNALYNCFPKLAEHMINR